MESSNKIAVLDSRLPLKAYPKEKLKDIIYKDFIVWLSSLLSLTDEVSAQRLFTAIPAIEKHCWSMGFDEIKKMFEMYADNNLIIKPIPNYFDRILFGKIVEAYKNQKPKKTKIIKEKVMTEDEKDAFMQEIIDKAIITYNKTGIIETATSKYDWLDSKGLLQKSFNLDSEGWANYKKDMYQRMKNVLIGIYELKKAGSRDEKIEIKNIIRDFHNKRNGKVIVASKTEILKEYLNKMNK